MTAGTERLSAFSGYGIGLAYMIVDRQDLSVLPIADQILRDGEDRQVNEVERGMMAWSKVPVRHVLEVKNRQPTESLEKLPCAFQNEVRYLNHVLEFYGAMLMPTAMHPWIDAAKETHVWPQHSNAELYAAHARVFRCTTHGWANLQSMHINLPFANDEEFGRLHAAIRLLLPIFPALAASSPIADGKATGFADFRMETCRSKAGEIPSSAGLAIPEAVSSRAEYEARILQPMYREIASLGPQGKLQHEWLSSRGAIACFDRNTMKIHVDVQECVQADLAIAAAAVANLRLLYDAGGSTFAAQQAIPPEELAEILLACTRHADQALIDNSRYLSLLGMPAGRYTAAELWRQLMIRVQQSPYRLATSWMESLQVILNHGPLARRILQAADNNFSLSHLKWVYRQLCQCLQQGHMFLPS